MICVGVSLSCETTARDSNPTVLDSTPQLQSPEAAVEEYFFALRERDFDRAFEYFDSREWNRDEYVEEMAMKMEWRVIHFQIHGTDKSLTDMSTVTTSVLIYGEGELSLDRIEANAIKVDGLWKVHKLTWGESVPIPIPHDWRSRLKLN